MIRYLKDVVTLELDPDKCVGCTRCTQVCPHAVLEMKDKCALIIDRDACMEFAIGSIGKMLGPKFAEIDAHPTRVRLPGDPLMLVDRIVLVEGEPGFLGDFSKPCSEAHGRVVTEHDVRPGESMTRRAVRVR